MGQEQYIDLNMGIELEIGEVMFEIEIMKFQAQFNFVANVDL